jgi:hypothetical protein
MELAAIGPNGQEDVPTIFAKGWAAALTTRTMRWLF